MTPTPQSSAAERECGQCGRDVAPPFKFTKPDCGPEVFCSDACMREHWGSSAAEHTPVENPACPQCGADSHPLEGEALHLCSECSYEWREVERVENELLARAPEIPQLEAKLARALEALREIDATASKAAYLSDGFARIRERARAALRETEAGA